MDVHAVSFCGVRLSCDFQHSVRTRRELDDSDYERQACGRISESDETVGPVAWSLAGVYRASRVRVCFSRCTRSGISIGFWTHHRGAADGDPLLQVQQGAIYVL